MPKAHRLAQDNTTQTNPSFPTEGSPAPLPNIQHNLGYAFSQFTHFFKEVLVTRM